MNGHGYHPLQNEISETETSTTLTNINKKTLVWLDEQANDGTSPNYRTTIDMFEKISGTNYKLYNSVDLFMKEIKWLSKIAELIVIMSGTFATEIIPNLSIELLREILSIFIFCKNYDKHKDLLKICRKVKYICTDHDSLKKGIEDELHPPTDFVIMDRKLEPIFILQENYQGFAWYKQYLDVIKNYPYANNNREKMIGECEKHYRTDNEQKKKIDHFRLNYNSDGAIQWYTKDSFLHRLVNKSLRSLDMEQILLFRPYIKDLCKQLEKLHEDNRLDKPLTLFRGHGNMNKRYFDQIRKNIDALISFNGFLSTSVNYDVAVIFAGSAVKQDVAVVFEIKANYAMKNVIFADISRFSDIPDEEEVLFSVCTVFKIEAVECDKKNRLWKIVLSATDEETLNLLKSTDQTISENQLTNELRSHLNIDNITKNPTNEEIIDRIDFRVKRSYRPRSIIIVSATVLIIVITMLIVTFEFYSKPKYKISNSYNCENGDCTTFTTTMAFNKLIEPIIATASRPPVSMPDDGICESATWSQNGITVAGGHGSNYNLDQIKATQIYLNDDDSMYIADFWHDRVLKWTKSATNGRLVAGGNGRGTQSNQVSASSLVVTKDGTLIICDSWHYRITAWTPGASSGQTLIDNVGCNGMTMDNQGSLYVSDWTRQRVRKWRMEGIELKDEKTVAFRLETPSSLFVDQNRTVYIVQWNPHRVVKWEENASEGEIIVGGNGAGNDSEHLTNPSGVIVDQLGTVYIVEAGNNRVTRWFKGAKSGIVVAGGNGRGPRADQLDFPGDLTFDRSGNLFVVDFGNYRIQMFAIDKSLCKNTTSSNS